MDVERIRPTPESIIHPPRHRRGPLRKAAPAWFLPPAALLVLLWAVPLGALTWRGLRAGGLPFASDSMVVQALRLSLVASKAAVVMARMYVGAPFLVRAARLGFDAVAAQLEEAPTTEGANAWQLFRFVMFPLAGRGVLGGLV